MLRRKLVLREKEKEGRRNGKKPTFLKNPQDREHLRHLTFLGSISPRIPVN